MQIGHKVSKYGIQAIKWDYGWWTSDICKTSSGTAWKCYEGLLELNNTTYINALKGLIGEPVTLKRFTDEAKKQGVTLTTYILLKDTGLDRDDVPTSKRHPEWFSDRIVTIGKSADLGNEEAVKFFQKYLSDFFISSGVTTWRSDFEPICKSSDKANRHASNGSDVQYWATVGFGELADYLIQNVEGFRYESCSSGGAMKDMFTMTKASVINCNDSADYMSQHLCFYDTSYAIHPAQIQLPVDTLTYNQNENYMSYYTAPADYMYGLRSQITGAIMLSNGPSSPDQTEKEHWTETIANDYEINLKPLIRNGDLYHILPRPDGKNWDGLEYVDLTSKNKIAAVMLWKPTGASNSKTVKLRGLDPNANYKLAFTDHTDQNTTKSGKDLMETGLTVTL